MVDTDAIARTLRTLAEGTVTARPPYAGVVDEAEAALEDPRRAASFADAGGLARLVDAVDAAGRDGKADLETRGREALDAYRRLQEALDGSTREVGGHRPNPTQGGAERSRNPYTREGATSDE
ncbi:MAG: hypothetical protein V5A46_01590 [Haloferacaceae archaeon]